MADFGITSVVPHKNKIDNIKKPMVQTDSMEIDDPPSADAHIGSIQCDQNWIPFINDSWLLGGVHSLQPFYLEVSNTKEEERKIGKPLVSDRDVWDSNADSGVGRLKILGREIACLYAFGYRQIVSQSAAWSGITFAPTQKSLATDASFGKIFKAVELVKSSNDVFALIGSETVDYENYLHPNFEYKVGAKMQVRGEVTAYLKNQMQNAHHRYELLSGEITILRLEKDNFNNEVVAIRASARCRRKMTGFPTEMVDASRIELYIYLSILNSVNFTP